jgi:hypothetical protein
MKMATTRRGSRVLRMGIVAETKSKQSVSACTASKDVEFPVSKWLDELQG